MLQYQELFAVCQALPGPASTKMLFCIALLHAGFIPAVFVFFLWSMPGAIAMYGLSLGVQRVDEVLPAPVYALLSGLNASTVGIIALAAVQLAEKAIIDPLTRILVIFGACAGLCYNALWYFPLLLASASFATLIWYGYLKRTLGSMVAKRRRRRRTSENELNETSAEGHNVEMQTAPAQSNLVQRKPDTPAAEETQVTAESRPAGQRPPPLYPEPADPEQEEYKIRVRVGVSLVVGFFASFIAIMLVRGLLRPLPRVFAVFANMYLAGTVIFGGGPVVIPLLRSYVVDPGWVSSRDFLIGLAIIQAMPGPNFNFAVYLGALAVRRSSTATIVGAMLGFFGIFVPGITLAVAVQSFWRVLRTRQWVIDLLRGINATAVGLVFTAVYRLWEIGYLTPDASQGKSLGLEPWWLVVATMAYCESAWFKVPPAVAIVFGAVLGLCWYSVVKA
jgi:chromate transport protein ChrA